MRRITEHLLHKRIHSVFTLLCLVALTLAACGGGGGGSKDDNGSSDKTVLTGQFVDAVVEGLSYQTDTQAGVTNSQGHFKYIQGEMVTFTLGGIFLGSATGASIITPVDLVSGATDLSDPRILNIVRLLLSLDDDGDSDNGISISNDVQAMAASQNVDLQSIDNNTELENLVNSITNNSASLVDPTSAETHLRNTMITMGVPVPGSFTVGGAVSGSTGPVILQNNGGNDLTVPGNTDFVFSTSLPDQGTYAVTVLEHPQDQFCSVENASGTISAADVTNVTVSCSEVLQTPAPQNLQAQAGDQQVTLTWNPVAGATAYNIYWNTVGNVTNGDADEPNVTSPFVHSGRNNDTRYYYIVTAVGPAGESEPSNEANAIPVEPPPNTHIPENVRVIDGEAQLDISWDAIPEASSYNIYIASVSNFTPGNYAVRPDGAMFTAQTSPITLSELKPATTYYVLVTSVDDLQNESNSSTMAHGTPYSLPIGSWQGIRQPALAPTYKYKSAKLNDEIYLLGAWRRVDANTIDNGSDMLEVYDIVNDIWKRKAPVPESTSGATVAVANNHLYIIGGNLNGGSTAKDRVLQYQPETDTWISKTPMPTARIGATSVTFNDKIYVFDGFYYENSLPVRGGLEIYDPVNDSWETKGAIPGEIARPGAALVLGDKIYLLTGGYLTEYNPVTDEYTPKAFMRTGRSGSAAVAYNGKIYTFGGDLSETVHIDITSTVEAYDPLNNLWQTLAPLPSPRADIQAHVVNDRILVFGSEYSAGIYEYIVAEDRFTTGELPVRFSAAMTGERKAQIINDVAYIHNTNASLDPIVAINVTTNTSVEITQPGIAACASAQVNGLLYSTSQVVAGNNGDIEIYNPAMDEWTPGAKPPYALKCHSTVIGTDIYLLAGLSSLVKYDTLSDEWSSVNNNAPIAELQSFSFEAYDGKLYIVGGTVLQGWNETDTNWVHRYDPGLNSWSTVAILNEPRRGVVTAVVNNKLYAFGGAVERLYPVGLVEVYDELANKWSVVSNMPTARMNMVGGIANNRIYMLGGNQEPVGYASGSGNVVEIYDPAN